MMTKEVGGEAKISKNLMTYFMNGPNIEYRKCSYTISIKIHKWGTLIRDIFSIVFIGLNPEPSGVLVEKLFFFRDVHRDLVLSCFRAPISRRPIMCKSSKVGANQLKRFMTTAAILTNFFSVGRLHRWAWI